MKVILFPYTTLFRSCCAAPASPSCARPWVAARDARCGSTWRTAGWKSGRWAPMRSEEHTSELQSHSEFVCRLLLEKRLNEHSPGKSSSSPSMRKAPYLLVWFFLPMQCQKVHSHAALQSDESYTLSLHDALPILLRRTGIPVMREAVGGGAGRSVRFYVADGRVEIRSVGADEIGRAHV